jgi:Na+(H+)/acetate symporter ActP
VTVRTPWRRGPPEANIGVSAVFVLITLVVVFRVSRDTRTAEDQAAAIRNAPAGADSAAPMLADALGGTDEVKVARGTAVVIGILAIAGGLVANGQNVAFLVALAFAVAASANLPTILHTLFWRRFNTSGALWSI